MNEMMGWRARSYILLGTRTKSLLKSNSRTKIFVCLGAIFSALTLLFLFSLDLHLFNGANPSSFALSTVNGQVCKGAHSYDRITEIPNFVHYVWILKDPTIFSLDFKFFITAYSAYLYFHPDKIYIHTDASREVFEQAKNSSDDWTRRILGLSNIEYHHISALTKTKKGVPIKKFEHKADFVRMDVLYEFGGIYMDTDAVPLRDITDLRKSGFANIVGGAIALTMKNSGYINNGVIMSAPGTALIDIYIQAAHQFFDGSWALASVDLLTDIANRIAAVPKEVLILQPKGFAPTSWEFADQKRLFNPHLETPAGREALDQGSGELTTCNDIFAWLKEREEHKVDKWEIDFSSTYVLHAFDGHIDGIKGWDGIIDLDYILARQSNYARAVYPAIAHAIRSGVVSEE